METVYSTRKKNSNNLSKEEKLLLNSPEYLHKCTKCNLFKPNTEYTINRTAPGRKFLSVCKECVKTVYINGINKESKLKSALKGRKVNRITVVFNSAKGNAKKKGREFSICKQDIVELFEKQKGLCYYTGKPMYSNILELENSNDSISIDRKDSSIGYTKDNIVLCRWIINKIKNDLTLEELVSILEDINKTRNNEYS